MRILNYVITEKYLMGRNFKGKHKKPNLFMRQINFESGRLYGTTI